MRTSGILMHISSLPNKYGIGTFGKEAYQFVDFLKKAGQTYWQILPLGHTSFGDSPYQTFSAFAGNPYFIDLDILKEKGLLEFDEYQSLNIQTDKVDFGFQYVNRYPILRKAYERFLLNEPLEFKSFKEENKWLNDYTLFMALKQANNGRSWLEWPDEYKKRNINVLNKFIIENEMELNFWAFLQYEFINEWKTLKQYANENGIKIIGDIPIYVAMDSADVWANVKYFQISEDYVPERVAGCPPDGFTPKGQLWGNPVYNYQNLAKDNYSWWVERIRSSISLYDLVRIDHFRGFEAFWSIPYGDPTAEFGKWVKGPNTKLFNAIKKELGDLPIIAEDLGFLTPGVYKMLRTLKFPGMKILEFGFDPWGNSEYAPHNVVPNCVVYPGSHDSSTIKEWYSTLPYENKRYVCEYLQLTDESKICEAIIKCALSTVANYVIIQMQDYLELGAEGRMNTPSTLGINWMWKASENQLIDDLAYRINSWTKLYRR